MPLIDCAPKTIQATTLGYLRNLKNEGCDAILMIPVVSLYRMLSPVMASRR